MNLIANILVALVALLHLYFLVLEMFLWTQPRGRRAFGTSPEFALASKSLAANQGLYNGFLAAGLLWGIYTNSFEFRVFFLICVVIAGLYGAYTVNRKIFFIQALPGMVALATILLAAI